MFSEEEKRAWKSISAPAALKDKVLGVCDTDAKQKRYDFSRVDLRRWGTLAACFMVAVVLTVALLLPSGSEMTVSLDGEVLSADSALTYRYDGPMMLARESVSYAMPVFEFKGDAETTVTIDSGELYLEDNGSTILCLGGTHTFDSDASFAYRVEARPDTVYTMTVESSDESFVIEMRYDEDTNSWSILKTNKD